MVVRDSFPNRENVCLDVFNYKGTVKFAFKTDAKSPPSIGILEFKDENNSEVNSNENIVTYAIFSADSSVEVHEKANICVPGSKVTFNAIPIDAPKNNITYLVTSLSKVHKDLPLENDNRRIKKKVYGYLDIVSKKFSTLVESLQNSESTVLTIDEEDIGKQKEVIVCHPTGRLVCMIDKKSGILEDQNRELAYFEKADLNLSPEYNLKDIVLMMTTCRDVTIRFQASKVLDGPVCNIVHDGTVALSPNVSRRYPLVVAQKPRVCTRPNSFSSSKVERAKNAIELYKKNEVLNPDDIINLGKYESSLQASSTVKDEISSNDHSLENVSGKVKTILNDNFGLLEFIDDKSEVSFCLFDTYDLYVEGDKWKTAACCKLTVSNIVAEDMEVKFHACKLPGAGQYNIPWLATGVWKETSSRVESPPVISPQAITKDKIEVFRKVAEGCALFVSGLLGCIVDAENLEEKQRNYEEMTDSNDSNDSVAPVRGVEKTKKKRISRSVVLVGKSRKLEKSNEIMEEVNEAISKPRGVESLDKCNVEVKSIQDVDQPVESSQCSDEQVFTFCSN